MAVGSVTEAAQAHGGRRLTAWQIRLLTFGLLVLITVAAAWLRVSGHDWDSDQHLNADDGYVAKVTLNRVNIPPNTPVATLLDTKRSPLNPRTGGEFYVYGTLPPYVVKAATTVLAGVTGDAFFSRYDGVLQTGRVLAGLFDTLTVLLVLGIGWRLWGRWTGLAAATLYACAILPIQTGHFYIVDSYTTTFMTAVLLCSVVAAQTQRPRWLAAAGLCVGLALACKVSAAPVLVLPLPALLPPLRGLPMRKAARRGVLLAALVGAAAFVGWFVADPFAVLDAPTYFSRLSEQAAITNGATDEWWARKYIGTWPILYPLGQLLLIGAGPLVGLAAFAGAALTAVRMRRMTDALLVIGPAVYFLSIALAETKWVRYLEPLVPYLCLWAVAFGLWLAERWRGVALGALIVSAGAGALAVSSIYHTPQTQVQASRWLYANVPPGAHIAIETTTTGLPLPLPPHKPGKEYALVPMDTLADQPNAQESAQLRKALTQADYVTLDMTQAALTVPRLPWRYPVQIRYYDLLLSGKLGFVPVYTATSYPTLFGLAIPDDGGWVDASFMDSSHPPIRIFQKERVLSDTEWATLFADVLTAPASPTRHAP